MYLKMFTEVHKSDVAIVGGKGASLGEMTNAGLQVPPGFIVTTDAYKAFAGHGLGDELQDAITAAYDQMGGGLVAVRSSAVAEDSAGASWAGQFDTYLNVSRNDLIASIEKCWQSASSDNVQTYAEQQKTPEADLALAVVIQQMVASEVSGVVFTINPVTHATDEVMIEAVYGLGELLVQGSITPDNYVVKKSNHELVSQNVPEKRTMLTYRDGATIEQPVSADISHEACLTPDQLGELTDLVVKIEDHYGCPQDIEWGQRDGTFYILQSRPVTT
jgi:phosphoenolpyruvate synthase/pyruvate phosphate dikinase